MSRSVSSGMMFASLFLLAMCSFCAAEDIEYLDAQPMSRVVHASVQPCVGGKIELPVITWGGDVATVVASAEGLFKNEGLDVELFLENNFAKQVEGLMSGRTPYLRGTMGMVNAASEACAKNGIDLVIVYQMTWSTGGDVMVVRDSIKTPSDLAGKNIGLQFDGPHMDYVANILASAKVPMDRVRFRWLRELQFPTYDTHGKIVDPVSAFQNDPTLDAVMVISPDAATLTSGGKVGTGAEGSVKGARILLSTKTASRIIADVYAVRKDYFDAHRAEVQKFVHALMLASERLADLRANRANNQAKYAQLLSQSATLLLGAPQATGDVEGLLGDCEFVTHAGNVQFFSGKGTTRSLTMLTDEIQAAFMGMGLMDSRVRLCSAEWDYTTLAAGLKNAGAPEAAKPKFDPGKVESGIAGELDNFANDGTLFMKEVNFQPNQKDFSEDKYAADFQEALKTVETYEGSLVVIEGHADPEAIRRAKERGDNPAIIAQMEQQVKNLSLDRARAVLQSFFNYCRSRGYSVDESRFVAVGMGIKSPKYPVPTTRDQWLANMRVAFRVKQVEGELDNFTPEGK